MWGTYNTSQILLFEKVCFIKIWSDNGKYCELNMENININWVYYIHFIVFNIFSCARHQTDGNTNINSKPWRVEQKCLYLKIESHALDSTGPNVRAWEDVSR